MPNYWNCGGGIRGALGYSHVYFILILEKKMNLKYQISKKKAYAYLLNFLKSKYDNIGYFLL